MSKPLWALVGIALLGTAGVAGAIVVASTGGEEEVVQQVQTGTPTAIVTGTPTATTPTPVVTLPSPKLGATLNYTDPTFGYSFDYPSTWYLSPPLQAGSDVTLQNYDPATAKGIGGPLPNDKLKAIFYVAQGVDKPLEHWISEARNDPGQPPPPTVLSTADITLGGKTGLTEIIEDEGERDATYYLALGGGRVLVIGVGPVDSLVWADFVQILASLHFAP